MSFENNKNIKRTNKKNIVNQKYIFGPFLNRCLLLDSKYPSTCLYMNSGKVVFFNILNKKFINTPFNPNIIIDKGMISCDEDYIDMTKNMFEYCHSYVKDTFDYITNEKIHLRFYKFSEYITSHNVFSSILFSCIYNMNSPGQQLVYLISKLLCINNFDIINTNYYLRYNSEPECRRLVVIETKIFFWFHLFFKLDIENNKILNETDNYFFYIWCFRNLKEINSPLNPSNKFTIISDYSKYMKMIDECKSLSEFFIMRYGPLYLSDEDLVNNPSKILKFYNKKETKEKLKECIMFPIVL